MASVAGGISRRSGCRPWIGWIAGATVTLLTGACASEQPAESSSTEDPIFGGVRDDQEPGVVALRIDDSGTYELCSGALLAPNVVLTARHCVTKSLGEKVGCDENGRSTTGPHVAGPEATSAISVFYGASPSFFGKPTALVRAIIAPDGDTYCNSDIALVVLDRELSGVVPFEVRLTAPARLGERIRAVGYGRNDANTPIGTRFRRDHVRVLAVGAGVSASRTPLGPREFEVGKSICTGDSGGPAISELTGAVIGVVSRGSACSSDFGNVYTSTAGFDDLFTRAFAEAGAPAAPRIETNTPPEILPESATSDEGDGGGQPKDSGCALASRGRDGASGAGLFALAALAAVLARRALRRSSP